MKKWDLQSRLKFNSQKFEIEELVETLLENRGIKTTKQIREFLNPKLESLTVQSLGINKSDLAKSLKRIKKAIGKKELIIIFGDYDADGICGTAVLWESLNSLGAKVMPYIPNRIEEGYGLSKIGIENLLKKYPETKIIITVDNGIVANAPTDFANSRGIDVIITDHHVPSKKLPNAYAIIHSTKICGAGVGWFLSKQIKNQKLNLKNSEHLDLVALATIADLVPLNFANRALVKFGLEKLKETKRVGVIALYDEAGIDKAKIDTYIVGHIIAPRLNAMGRLEEAMDSLRLLCTRDKNKARILAKTLGEINRARQQITINAYNHAREQIGKKNLSKLLFVYHESYQPGVIGLVAGRLTEEYYLPSIVISKGKNVSKASARSVTGLNIIEFIREASEFLLEAGGHPMAAGFSIETAKIPLLEKKFEELTNRLVLKKNLIRKLKIDCELPIETLNLELFEAISRLEPFGMGNPTPVFLSRGVLVSDVRVVGMDQKHVKIVFSDGGISIEAMYFNGAEKLKGFKVGDMVEIVYSLVLNEWNGNKKLELRIKDMLKV